MTHRTEGLTELDELRPEEKLLPILWAAFLVASGLYVVVAWVVGRSGIQPVNQELLRWVQVFLAMSGGLIILSVFLLRQLSAALSRRNYRNWCVIRWALLETIAVFGLIQVLLGGEFEIMLVFVAASVMGLGATRPGLSDRADFVAQFR